MKKILLIAISIFMASQSFAQTIGVKGGLNISNMMFKDEDRTYSEDYKNKAGFHVGVTGEIPISDMFAIETGLILSTKGYRIKEQESLMGVSAEFKSRTNLYYLDIPVTAKAIYDLGEAKIYGNFGPYIGIGISGRTKTEVSVFGDTATDEEDIEWGSDKDNDNLKRLDLGLLIGAGVEISSVTFGVTYGLGLANISPYTEDGVKVRNRVFSISVGYKFNQ